MEARVNDGKGGYLRCNVDCEVSNYLGHYNSAEECLHELLPEVASDCLNRGYDEEETRQVLSYYEIKFSNFGGIFKEKY